MKKLFFILLAFVSLSAFAQSPYNQSGWLPTKGDHFVYDFCGLLTPDQTDTLEFALRQFSDSTSNQIVLIITPSLGGRDAASFATEVGNSWGIGQNSLNNGVVIVIKPKDDTDGETWIATGDGLEGVLPDIFCKRIVEEELIPHFRDDDYYGGICAALDVILPVCAGEYSYDEYQKDKESNPLLGAIIGLGIFAALIWWIAKKDSGGSHGSWSSRGYGHTYSGGWSSGHSSSSHPTFGGGHFGGGGAGGRW